MTTPRPPSADRLLTVEAAAERMSTSTRFIRRLIAERRIAYVKIGSSRADHRSRYSRIH
jgi:excisionase family DNA binding protein